jgi:5-methylthioadenosine/S-adenosylhomocysteine deaminase
MQRAVIRGGDVLVGAPIDGRVEPADVVIEDGRIAAIAPDAGPVGEAEELDARGCFVIPGFVDTHHHLWQTTMRGICADWDLTDYYWCIRVNHAVVHGADDIYAGTYAGALDALGAGTTCTIDFSHCLNSPDHADEAVRAIKESGIRALWCYGFYAPPLEEPFFETPEDRFEDARRVREQHFAANGRVSMGVALNELGLVPFATTREEVELARELDVSITAHTAAVWHPERFPEVEWLDRAGLLGPNQVHSHCNTCSDGDFDLLRESGAAVSATPDTELQMGMGYPIVGRAWERGLLPSIGGDIQSNNRQDPFTQMRLALQAERLRRLQPIIENDGLEAVNGLPLSTREILHFATLGGATALGLGDVCGSIEPGKAADLVLLRHDQLHMRPVIDPIASIVLHAGQEDVDTVLVDGEVVKRGGRMVHRDIGAAISGIDQAAQRVGDRIAARGGWKPPMPDGLMAQVTASLRENMADAPEAVAR